MFLNLRAYMAEQDRWWKKVATVVLLATVLPFTILLRVRDQWRLSRRIRARRLVSRRKVEREESSSGGES